MTQLKWFMLIVVLGLLALVSISPFLASTLPLTDDGNLHIYRSIVLDDAIRNDASLYPRYATALAYGYGASLFNYFPPSSYYPTVIFHAIGVNWVAAWKTTVILYVLLAALGTFLWARQWLDDMGAFIAAAAYIYAPYTLFDTITRGSSNEFAGMALLPFALWGFTRLARSGRRSDYLIAIFSYALFIMAHNVMTLYGSLLLIAYCGFLWLTHEKPSRVLWQLGSAGILAVLITAFFWLPALTETDFVKINGVLDNLAFVDVTHTLRSLGDVFALPRTADPSQLQATVPISFSWILVILAIIGFFLPQPPRTDHASDRPILGLHLLLFAILAIVIFSQLKISADLWQSVRLLQYSQFAWRPMSIGSLVLALLAAIGGTYSLRLIPSQFGKFTGLGLLLSVIVLYSVSWLYRPEIALTADTVADAQNYELVSRQPVLSSYGEYLPALTQESALNPLRFQEETSRLPESDNYAVISIEEKSRRLSAELDLNAATTLIVEWLYVPGWSARVDGETVDVMPIGDAGFLGFEVPEGSHEIEVWYAGTGMQRNASIVSIMALLTVIGFALYLLPNTTSQAMGTNPLNLWVILIVGILGLGLFGIKTQIIDHVDSPFRHARFQDGILANLDMPLDVNFNQEIRLLGAEVDNSVPSGASTEIKLYWTLASGAITIDYSTLVQLVDSQGIVIAEASNFYPGGLATHNWLPAYYIEETIILDVPLYTPPLDYNIVVGVFHSENGQRLDLINELGNPTGIDANISVLHVERPTSAPDRVALPLPLLTTAGFEFLSIDDLPTTAQVGDELVFSWLWRAFNPQSTFTPQLLWENQGAVTITALVQDFPISEWQANDVWRGYQRIYVPPTLHEGNYNLSVRIGGEEASIGQLMHVTVPERDFELPEIENELETIWQNGILLRGYEQTDSSLSLHWQTQAIIDENLRLFVQVFNVDGQILAIDDTFPLNGQRPTTSWITDEFITTSHELGTLPDGEYTILIGWYQPLTGQRIVLRDTAADAFELAVMAFFN